MIKKICFIISCLILPLATQAMEEIDIEGSSKFDFEESSKALRKAADQYLNFIDQISQGEVFSHWEAAAEILSPNCKKILNGQLFTDNREDFVTDLLSVYENQGPWKVYPVDIIADTSSNTVVLRLFIEMKNFGTYTAIVILRYDASYLITEINEVLTQVKGSYDFKDNH